MAAVRYDKVVKRFSKTARPVVNKVSLTLASGEFVVFVGPSGCGKTTLLRMLAGLESVSDGELYIGERKITHVHPKKRDCAMVFQNYALYPHMTTAENIGFGLKIRGVNASERERAVREVAELLGLSDLLERRPRQLSGGQRQRVAMGRAIVRQPAVFLMDEPLSNLDAQLRNQMRVDIKELQQRLATTTIYVTHDQTEAMTMADRIVVLRDGEVQQVGTPNELYQRPLNRFVAGFIGSPSMNFISAERVNESALALPDGQTIELPKAHPAAGRDRLTIGIRPEHLYPAEQLRLNGTACSHARWQSSIRLLEPLGGETIVHTHLGNTPIKMKLAHSAANASGPLQSQQPLNLAFGLDNAYFFDPDSGRVL